jgi:hypothetical protein
MPREEEDFTHEGVWRQSSFGDGCLNLWRVGDQERQRDKSTDICMKMHIR